MNVNKEIARLRKTRKLNQIVLFHTHASPSVQLNDFDFELVKPCLNVLFRSLSRQGFNIHISLWGEVIFHSPIKQFAFNFRVTKSVLPGGANFQASKEKKKYNLTELAEATALKHRFNFSYFYINTKSIWRHQQFVPSEYAEKDASALINEILKNGEQFEGRIVQENFFDNSIAFDDLRAIAAFAVRYGGPVRAWKGILMKLGQFGGSNLEITPSSISFEHSFPQKHHEFFWHRADLAFIRKYCRQFNEFAWE